MDQDIYQRFFVFSRPRPEKRFRADACFDERPVIVLKRLARWRSALPLLDGGF
jgi:hypothetical protein